ncbi:MAG: NAD-dependent malic enzyme [Candidatus Omnitrophica bacterium]|nr:NAD-dependent malic enzyme [Candidatus Omnitrophota bacterium]
MDNESNFSSNNKVTIRLELVNRPGVFASVAALIASAKAGLGAVDIVDVTATKIIRDVTFDVAREKDAEKILKGLGKLKNVRIIAISDRVLLLHLGGKIQVHNKTPLQTRNQLSMAYTPGVAKVSQVIAKNPEEVYKLTIKANSVAIVTDGSAILGLGNLGPEAALPVMEGKAMIFKEFANIDAWPICLATQNVDEIVKTVQNIAPAFGGINLEDISAPRCFEIEERLKKILSIPVMHDDQHGTAVVILAALKNALKVVKKDIKRVHVVVNGLGAAGAACCRILLAAGVSNLLACNRKGVVLIANGANLDRARQDLFSCASPNDPVLTLREALRGADVFIGVSAGNILSKEDLKVMKKDRIVFAMANPDPEIDPHQAFKVCRVFATGRSDFPNQINNALAFPGIFRGALNVRAKQINEAMKIAASDAIANLILPTQLSSEYIVPSIFDKRVVEAVTKAVEGAAHQTGVAQSIVCS